MTQHIINDLTIQAATVNGSGSQTANLVLTRAIFHMGIPVAPKNVFPSNIEGLPTWYQLRISPRGYQARHGDPDLLVSLNPATWSADASINGVGIDRHILERRTRANPQVGPPWLSRRREWNIPIDH